jgi:hypothetical protein
MARHAIRFTLVVVAVTAAAATAEAVALGQWGIVGTLVVLDLAVIVLLGLQFGPRRPVTVRADLEAWLRERATGTGEAPDVLVDRAVGRYRSEVQPARTGPAG